VTTDRQWYAHLALLAVLVFGGIAVATESVSGEQFLRERTGRVARVDPVTISGTATGNPDAVPMDFGQNSDS
jgi:hypothetical protein